MILIFWGTVEKVVEIDYTYTLRQQGAISLIRKRLKWHISDINSVTLNFGENKYIQSLNFLVIFKCIATWF